MTHAEALSADAEARASYLFADEAETRLRIRDAIARRDAGERVQYLVESEGIGLILVRQDLRKLGIDTSRLPR